MVPFLCGFVNLLHMLYFVNFTVTKAFPLCCKMTCVRLMTSVLRKTVSPVTKNAGTGNVFPIWERDIPGIFIVKALC